CIAPVSSVFSMLSLEVRTARRVAAGDDTVGKSGRVPHTGPEFSDTVLIRFGASAGLQGSIFAIAFEIAVEGRFGF
ncbi:MAG: hypothetical protein AAF471_08575, partial [Myxococcota bacterium]